MGKDILRRPRRQQAVVIVMDDAVRKDHLRPAQLDQPRLDIDGIGIVDGADVLARHALDGIGNALVQQGEQIDAGSCQVFTAAALEPADMIGMMGNDPPLVHDRWSIQASDMQMIQKKSNIRQNAVLL